MQCLLKPGSLVECSIGDPILGFALPCFGFRSFASISSLKRLPAPAMTTVHDVVAAARLCRQQRRFAGGLGGPSKSRGESDTDTI